MRREQEAEGQQQQEKIQKDTGAEKEQRQDAAHMFGKEQERGISGAVK